METGCTKPPFVNSCEVGGGAPLDPGLAVERVVRCTVCFDDVGVGSDVGLHCGHGICSDCFVAYLASRVGSGEVGAELLCCPVPACRLPISEGLIAELLRGTEDRGKMLHTRNYKNTTPSENATDKPFENSGRNPPDE